MEEQSCVLLENGRRISAFASQLPFMRGTALTPDPGIKNRQAPCGACRFLVRAAGLEPARRMAMEPKSIESTNSTTPAYSDQYSTPAAVTQAKIPAAAEMLIYKYIANRQRLCCVLQINERRYINMRIKVYGKSHLEGIAKKTGNPYNFNQVHYLGKARNVIGQAAMTLALDPIDYPIDTIEVGKEYNVEFDNRGYVVDFAPIR